MRRPRPPAPNLDRLPLDSRFTCCRAVLLGLLAMLGGCHHSDTAAGPAPVFQRHRSAKPGGPTVAQQTAGMVDAPSLTKALPGFQLKFDLQARPTPHAPLTLDLAIVPSGFAELAAVDVEPPAEVQLAPADRQYTVSALEPQTVYRHSVNLTPIASGMVMIGVNVAVRHDGVIDTLKFAIPLMIGGPGAKVPPPSSAAATPVATTPGTPGTSDTPDTH
ncbi:MAG: hypothetical protein KGL34_11055 [Gammaproteobacteria bacterium]|nr:hypothetical protein [Gammaproteobacteria bacterium]